MTFDNIMEIYSFAYKYLEANGAHEDTCHDFANFVADRWRDDDYDNWLHHADMSAESRRYSVSKVIA
jgi:hypothetical protein